MTRYEYPLCRFAQRGVGLVELMIALALGLLVVGATAALLFSTKASYAAQDEISRVQDAGTYALESISRAVRQAAYVDLGGDEAGVLATTAEPGIVGHDARRITGAQTDTSGIDSPLSDSVVNGSDVLAVRFFGSGSGTNGDGTVVDCAGTGVPIATSQTSADDARGMSIFYVAKSSSGEPELYCRWHGESKWSSQPIVRGVESFQVLYGLDTDGDYLPNRFVNATTINALDDALVLEGENATALAADRQKKTQWKKVVAVRIALLVRGSSSARDDAMTNTYDLFGESYGDAYAKTDVGTRINEASMSSSTRNRIRKVFSLTIQLRNSVVGGSV